MSSPLRCVCEFAAARYRRCFCLCLAACERRSFSLSSACAACSLRHRRAATRAFPLLTRSRFPPTSRFSRQLLRTLVAESQEARHRPQAQGQGQREGVAGKSQEGRRLKQPGTCNSLRTCYALYAVCAVHRVLCCVLCCVLHCALCHVFGCAVLCCVLCTESGAVCCACYG